MIRVLKWLGLGLLISIAGLVAPIFYVETICRAESVGQIPAQYAIERRTEARTYLVYPEWHIVYAYEGYAEVLKTGAPHNFPYLQAIGGFWSALCDLTARSDQLGEAGFDSKATIYTIGASFTFEMLLKAGYEESLGRLFRGDGTSVQDHIEAEMAEDYAKFLQQVPWYKFDFDHWNRKLWRSNATDFRGWERRIALGLEWGAKAQYAKLIGALVESVGHDELTMQVVLTDITETALQDIPDLEIISTGEIILANMRRYRVFTTAAIDIAEQGGRFIEIAGNDDIMLSYIGFRTPDLPHGEVFSKTKRVGFEMDNRYLIALKVGELTNVLRRLALQDGRVEHIYDY